MRSRRKTKCLPALNAAARGFFAFWRPVALWKRAMPMKSGHRKSDNRRAEHPARPARPVSEGHGARKGQSGERSLFRLNRFLLGRLGGNAGPGVVLGSPLPDLWRKQGMTEKVVIGNAELWHGDCREVLPLLARFDVVVTDPPYGVGLTGKATKHTAAGSGGYLSFEDTPENVLENVIPTFVSYIGVCARAVVTPGTRMAFYYPKPDAMGGIYNSCGAGSGRWGFECVAPVLYYGKDPYLQAGLGRRPNGWEQPPQDSAEKNGHPCPKPLGLMRWLVNRASMVGESVCDPFMGSGTTGVVCLQMGRNFTGIERERRYFDTACERISRAQAQGSLLPPEDTRPHIQEELLP